MHIKKRFARAHGQTCAQWRTIVSGYDVICAMQSASFNAVPPILAPLCSKFKLKSTFMHVSSSNNAYARIPNAKIQQVTPPNDKYKIFLNGACLCIDRSIGRSKKLMQKTKLIVPIDFGSSAKFMAST